MKVYGRCENKCQIETVSREEIEANYLNRKNYKIVTFTKTDVKSKIFSASQLLGISQALNAIIIPRKCRVRDANNTSLVNTFNINKTHYNRIDYEVVATDVMQTIDVELLVLW